MNKNKCKIRDKFYNVPAEKKVVIQTIQNNMLQPDTITNTYKKDLFTLYPFLNSHVNANKILKQQSYYILIYHAHNFQSHRYIRFIFDKNAKNNCFDFIKYDPGYNGTTLPVDNIIDFLKTNYELYNLNYQGIIESNLKYPILFFQYKSQNVSDEKINYICEQDLVNKFYFNYTFHFNILHFFTTFPTIFDVYYDGHLQLKPRVFYISNDYLLFNSEHLIFKNPLLVLNNNYSQSSPHRIVGFLNNITISENIEDVVKFDLVVNHRHIYTINHNLLYLSILV